MLTLPSAVIADKHQKVALIQQDYKGIFFTSNAVQSKTSERLLTPEHFVFKSTNRKTSNNRGQ